MQDDQLTRDDASEGVVAIDPFAFVPNLASCIVGLGGPESADDSSYAFHTPYVYCAPGPATFSVRFTGLEARRGNLTLRVNAIAPLPGAAARTVKMASCPLAEVAATSGEFSITVPARADTLYAIQGQVYGTCDASAVDLTMTLDRPSNGSGFVDQLNAARSTVFGHDRVAGHQRLVTSNHASLAHPVSQMCTSAQFDEPAYDHWVSVMQTQKHMHRKQWEFVYVMQVLDRYGMLQSNSRGLGFGCGHEQLPAIFAARGCSIVATDLSAEDARSAGWSASNQHSAGLDQLRYSNICPPERFDEAVTYRPVDMNAIPEDLTSFDFCWSSCALEHLGSIRAGLDFIVNSLRPLKVGGIAVHTTELNLISDEDTIDNESTVLFRRSDFERLALELISHGHEVAQFCYDQGDKPLDRHVDMPPYSDDNHLKLALNRFVTTSFGIIVRKGPEV